MDTSRDGLSGILVPLPWVIAIAVVLGAVGLIAGILLSRPKAASSEKSSGGK